MKEKVAIIMGSKSDMEIAKKSTGMLEELGIGYTINIFSAHRTPNDLREYIERYVNSEKGHIEVVIALAGMSAALAGVIASETLKPVISVPLSGGKFKGVEAVLSTIEMPPGVPVLSVGIDAGKNAALAAARIIALHDEHVKQELKRFIDQQAEKVKIDNATLNR